LWCAPWPNWPRTWFSKARSLEADLEKILPHELGDIIRGHDALICCAGHVTAGERFVGLLDNIIEAIERIEEPLRPRCWFIGGAAALQIGDSSYRGIDLPKVRDIYWPHGVNLERLSRSTLAWSLLCPGPMIDKAPIGIERMRLSTDKLPVDIPGFARLLAKPLLLPFLAARTPEMIIPYEDAAMLMLTHLQKDDEFVRRRVGIGLPRGMRGRKETWTAQPSATHAAAFKTGK
jgi:uncharacterized protein